MAEPSDTLVTVKSNSVLQVDSETLTEISEDLKTEKAFFPLLIAESTLQGVPTNLATIIENLKCCGGSDVDRNDLIVAVFFVLMIESGFVPNKSDTEFHIDGVNFHKDRVLAFMKMPANWKSDDGKSYYLEFVLQPFATRVCKMVCHKVNTNINVNLVADPICNCYAYFRVPKYVISEDSQSISLKFRHLDELSVDFKDQIANTAKIAILREEGMPHESLQDLPSEVLYQILVKLPVSDYLHLTTTCRRMKECADYFGHDLWKKFVARDFPYMKESKAESWSNMYKEELKKQRQKRSVPQRFRRNYWDYMDMDII